MILKESKLYSSEKLGLMFIKVIHLYKGFNRKKSTYGNVVLVSIKKTKVFSDFKKKTLLKSLLIRLKYPITLIDGASYFFFFNSSISIKKGFIPRTSSVLGPISKRTYRKKILYNFSSIL